MTKSEGRDHLHARLFLLLLVVLVLVLVIDWVACLRGRGRAGGRSGLCTQNTPLLSRPSPISKRLTHCGEQPPFESASTFESLLPPDYSVGTVARATFGCGAGTFG